MGTFEQGTIEQQIGEIRSLFPAESHFLALCEGKDPAAGKDEIFNAQFLIFNFNEESIRTIEQ